MIVFPSLEKDVFLCVQDRISFSYVYPGSNRPYKKTFWQMIFIVRSSFSQLFCWVGVPLFLLFAYALSIVIITPQGNRRARFDHRNTCHLSPCGPVQNPLTSRAKHTVRNHSWAWSLSEAWMSSKDMLYRSWAKKTIHLLRRTSRPLPMTKGGSRHRIASSQSYETRG